MISRTVVFCVPFFVLVMALTSYSDTLLLKNNSQLIGKILQETPEQIFIDVNGIQMTVKRADVLSIIQNGVKKDIGDATQTIPLGPVSPATETVPVPPVPAPPVQNPLIPLPGTTNESPASTPGIGPKISQPIQGSIPQAAQEETQVLLPVIIPSVKAYMVNGNGVFFREGPNIQSAMKDTLPNLAILTEIELVDNWLHARYKDGKEGWVPMNFIQPLLSKPCLVTGANVQVRELPGELFRVLAKLPKGDVIIKLKEEGEWVQILSGTMVGWAHKNYLTEIKDRKPYELKNVLKNEEVQGTPLLVQKNVLSPTERKLTFTVRDDNMVLGGMTKVMVLFPKKEQLATEINYKSDALIHRQRISSSAELVNNGFPAQFGVSYVGCDILTLLGQRKDEGWLYEITTLADDSLTFAFVVQKGPNKGVLVTIQ